MSKDKPAITERPIIYITRDLERALPLVFLPGYFVITNYSSFAKQISERTASVHLCEPGKIFDTLEILKKPETAELLARLQGDLVVFKNTPAIERYCAQKNWRLLNPPAILAAQVEEKISQISWLGDLTRLLPPYRTGTGKDVVFAGTKFIVQFNHSHTGDGTLLIDSAEKAAEIARKFPDRPLRIMEYIDGPVFTCNAVVAGKKILTGSISYQITGLEPFTDSPFATVGNDWSLARAWLKASQKKKLLKIVELVGKKLAKEGWRGLFGVDAIIGKNGKVFLLEINARQPASTSFESALQANQNKELTTMIAHLKALQKHKITGKIPEVRSGAQIILRVRSDGKKADLSTVVQNLNQAGLYTIEYDNREPLTDRLRIMSKKGIMANHNVPNNEGQKIQKLLEQF